MQVSPGNYGSLESVGDVGVSIEDSAAVPEPVTCAGSAGEDYKPQTYHPGGYVEGSGRPCQGELGITLDVWLFFQQTPY